jgi:hypothetical protein
MVSLIFVLYVRLGPRPVGEMQTSYVRGLASYHTVIPTIMRGVSLMRGAVGLAKKSKKKSKKATQSKQMISEMICSRG